MAGVTWPEEFLEGARMFNAGLFFETHEVWEDIWRKAPAEERDFYQGMIHLTVALYQARRGNRPAADSQLRRAARRLARYEPARGELDLSGFRAAVAETVARLHGGRAVNLDQYPKLNLAARASRESPPAPGRSPRPAGKRPR